MDHISEWIFGLLAAALAFVGLVLWAGAHGFPMAWFGCGLTFFGVAFDFFLLKRHFDRLEAGR